MTHRAVHAGNIHSCFIAQMLKSERTYESMRGYFAFAGFVVFTLSFFDSCIRQLGPSMFMMTE